MKFFDDILNFPSFFELLVASFNNMGSKAEQHHPSNVIRVGRSIIPLNKVPVFSCSQDSRVKRLGLLHGEYRMIFRTQDMENFCVDGILFPQIFKR